MRAPTRLAAATCAAALLALPVPAWGEPPDHAGPPDDTPAGERKQHGRDRDGEGDSRGDEMLPLPNAQPVQPVEQAEPRERDDRDRARRSPRRAPPVAPRPGPESDQPMRDRLEEPRQSAGPEPGRPDESTDRPARGDRSDCPDAVRARPGEELRSLREICAGETARAVRPVANQAGGGEGSGPPTGPLAALAAAALLAGVALRARGRA